MNIIKDYSFQVGNKPKYVHEIDLTQLISDDAITQHHYQVFAKNMAKFLSEITGKSVLFHPKGQPENTIKIDWL